jgi:hypothetical protein
LPDFPGSIFSSPQRRCYGSERRELPLSGHSSTYRHRRSRERFDGDEMLGLLDMHAPGRQIRRIEPA